MRVSVVIPALNEARALPALLGQLAAADEVLVVDGGSTDATVRIARDAGVAVLDAPRGRGRQLAAGAAAATGDVFWFLHADTGVPGGALDALRAADAPWGCFSVRIPSDDVRLRAATAIMNVRARRTGSCTGDMGIWARRAFYADIGGFPPLDALEDLVFSDKARARDRGAVLAPVLTTSARRWEERGVARTLATMVTLRAAYRCGVAPARLARLYRGAPRGEGPIR